jgi:hypothetical protein
MIITKKHLPRRTFLQGVARATLSLPLLDSIIPALTASPQSHFRAAFVYTPHGVIPDKWVPKSVGTGYEMTSILQPLEPFRDRFVVLSNLGENSGKQAGSGHASSSATWLSAGQIKDTAGEDVHAASRHIQPPQGTPIANLLLRMLDFAGVPTESIGDSAGKLEVREPCPDRRERPVEDEKYVH